MKSFTITSILSLAALTIAAPTVELTLDRRQAGQSAFAQSCASKKGILACCQNTQQPGAQPALTGGLIGALLGALDPAVGIGCLAVVLQVPACNQVDVCCASSPQPAGTSSITGLVNVLPNAQICPAITI